MEWGCIQKQVWLIESYLSQTNLLRLDVILVSTQRCTCVINLYFIEDVLESKCKSGSFVHSIRCLNIVFDIAVVEMISWCFCPLGYFEMPLYAPWSTQAPLMHDKQRHTGVIQVCIGDPQHPYSRKGQTEPGKGFSSFSRSPPCPVAHCWTVSNSVQLGESRLRPGTLPLWGSSRGSL